MDSEQMIAPGVRLVRRLGSGGMGTIWLAEHAALERRVAVKVMSEELAAEPLAVARFRREAAAVAQLKSERIVEILDFGLTAYGAPFMVTELLEGEDLGEYLEGGRLLSPRDAGIVIHQVCEGLAEAHDIGIVHRDIKPENIFLLANQESPTIKVLDFGIAKKWREPTLDVTSTGSVIGTPHYMSPEQLLSSKHVDYRADLWSIAVLAYRLLTGRLPFPAHNFAALCISIHRGVFKQPSVVRKGLPEQLDAWFTKALRGHPSARFGSALEMAEAFVGALKGKDFRGKLAGPRASLEPPPPSSRHRVELSLKSVLEMKIQEDAIPRPAPRADGARGEGPGDAFSWSSGSSWSIDSEAEWNGPFDSYLIPASELLASGISSSPTRLRQPTGEDVLGTDDLTCDELPDLASPRDERAIGQRRSVSEEEALAPISAERAQVSQWATSRPVRATVVAAIACAALALGVRFTSEYESSASAMNEGAASPGNDRASSVVRRASSEEMRDAVVPAGGAIELREARFVSPAVEGTTAEPERERPADRLSSAKRTAGPRLRSAALNAAEIVSVRAAPKLQDRGF